MTEPTASRRIVVLTAPSGAGKTTIARRVLEAVPELRFSVSVTTRPRRPHERPGVDYHFVDEAQFQQYLKAGDLLEYEEVYPGRFYGTLRSEVEDGGPPRPVLLDVDVCGAEAIKRTYGDDALVIFLQPPSIDELARRLRGRHTENAESLHFRLERSRKELAYANRFDVVVVNEELDEAVAETLRAVRTFLNS